MVQSGSPNNRDNTIGQRASLVQSQSGSPNDGANTSGQRPSLVQSQSGSPNESDNTTGQRASLVQSQRGSPSERDNTIGQRASLVQSPTGSPSERDNTTGPRASLVQSQSGSPNERDNTTGQLALLVQSQSGSPIERYNSIVQRASLVQSPTGSPSERDNTTGQRASLVQSQSGSPNERDNTTGQLALLVQSQSGSPIERYNSIVQRASLVQSQTGSPSEGDNTTGQRVSLVQSESGSPNDRDNTSGQRASLVQSQTGSPSERDNTTGQRASLVQSQSGSPNGEDNQPESGPPKATIRISLLPDPPDGGTRAYIIVVGAFIVNGLIFGPVNSFSVVYPFLVKRLQDAGSKDAERLASLLGSLTLGVTFFLSPITGVLTGILGLRTTTVLGGGIAVCGCLMSALLTHSINALFLTYGVLYGMGASFAYTPSLAILGLYFKKKLGLANGIVSSGGSVFTIVMPAIYEFILGGYGLRELFGFLTVMNTLVAVCGLLFKPLVPKVYPGGVKPDWRAHIKEAMRKDLFKKRSYKIWILSMPIALFGYYVPYVHLKMFMMTSSFTNTNYNMPLIGMACLSAVSPTIVGLIADRPSIDAVVLQQVSFAVIGCITVMLPFVKSFPLLVSLTSAMGLFDGAFVALIGPVATRLAGVENAAQGIGFMLGLVAIPMSIGPGIAGQIFAVTQSYTLPFLLSGSTPLVGAALMTLIHFHKHD